jgi:hypothetical protein
MYSDRIKWNLHVLYPVGHNPLLGRTNRNKLNWTELNRNFGLVFRYPSYMFMKCILCVRNEIRREDVSINERIGLKWTEKLDGIKKTTFIWLRIGTCGGFLWTQKLTFVSHKIGDFFLSSWTQEGLCSMELERFSNYWYKSYGLIRNFKVGKR